ncbi:MAG TPA: PQQ-dependent sugar dehydrogenase [Caulobacteraceae bacterium]
MHRFVLAALLLTACGAGQTDAQPTVKVREQTAETRAPNTSYQPALPGQTRAPLKRAGVKFAVRTVAEGLDHPWGLDFLPDGQLLVTERAGRMRLVAADGTLGKPITGLPKADARGQGGLLDVAVGPDGLIYWSYAQPREGGNGTAVARGRLAGDAMEDVQVIWAQTPTLDSKLHFGGRLVFAPDGKLFITTGERSILEGRRQAQRPDGTLGKVVRINPDGSIPKDNPLVGKAGARPEIWTIGHRNIQGAAIRPGTDELWTVEHGPRGGDEINVEGAGKDYGWPTISYGIEYSGGKIGQGITQAEGMEQPIYYWDPVIAPSGMAFYDADLFPAWKGSLFIGGMNPGKLVRLTLDGYRVAGEEWLLEDLGERIRDVNVGPDGALYLLTDEADGKILRMVPSPLAGEGGLRSRSDEGSR